MFHSPSSMIKMQHLFKWMKFSKFLCIPVDFQHKLKISISSLGPQQMTKVSHFTSCNSSSRWFCQTGSWWPSYKRFAQVAFAHTQLNTSTTSLLYFAKKMLPTFSFRMPTRLENCMTICSEVFFPQSYQWADKQTNVGDHTTLAMGRCNKIWN